MSIEETQQEIESVNWAEEYAEAATAPVTPPEGSYQLRLPDEIPDGAFEVRAFAGQKPFLQVTLDPVTIVGGEFDGVGIRFFKITTRLIQELIKDGDSWKPGKTLNASDASDLLKNFGSGDTPSTSEEWRQAFRRLAGQVTPHGCYLTWGGYDKLATGKAKYLKAKAFPKGSDGVRQAFVERTNEAGETRRVYARLELGRRGAAVSSSK